MKMTGEEIRVKIENIEDRIESNNWRIEKLRKDSEKGREEIGELTRELNRLMETELATRKGA
jgi:chaperonin cofactor prefoldin